ncbi:protein tramtrack, beta isoform-like isoform X2 [Coccinella septempunctata]|uniref:protein tramtrack, beta isoform-like isoform X2 n=1 Tax=Coccinella septempunctata TaxID=41139 RepID=UPI001D079B55|nr:protein tramtrack, beta isoform-like isoform X2 [Coccinella septempunctata]
MATSSTHTQQFALKWNNFHSNLSSGFHELFEAADMVDVTLAMDGKFLQAHKVVLSICSPYFKEMFKVNPCKHPIVILKGVGHEHMKDILEFMYLGEVSVLRENLTSFLRTAELLQVKGLTGDDSSESSSKEDEKYEGDNDEDEDYTKLMQDMQYTQPYNTIDNHIGINSQYTPTATTCNSSPPPPIQHQLPLPNINIPPTNNKRPKNSNGSNVKRNKTDNNGNQNIPSKSVPLALTKKEDDDIREKKKVPSLTQESEPEYTDLSYIKSEKSSADEEGMEKLVEPKNNSLIESFVDQGKPDAKYAMKPSYVCEMCPKRFSRRDHLRTHEKNIHGEDAGPFVCIVCSQLYKNTESLRKHISKFHMAPKQESLILNSAKA